MAEVLIFFTLIGLCASSISESKKEKRANEVREILKKEYSLNNCSCGNKKNYSTFTHKKMIRPLFNIIKKI